VAGGFVVAGGVINDETRFEVDQITGGAWPLDTDLNGRIRIVDGTGTGEINTNGGAIVSVTTTDTATALGANSVNTTSVQDGTITAAKIAADAITNAKIADDAIAAENLATGALTADAFAADALIAATFATDAFTSDALATSWADEIRTGLAVPADLMGLANDAITASKYDETTAFPLALADSGSDKIARTGADSDTLETISDQVDGVPTTAEFEARTILAAAYFDPAADAVASVTVVDTTTTIDTTGLDAIISRGADNVEDTAGVFSLAHGMLSHENSDVTTNVGKRTTFKSDGSTEFTQTTIATDDTADPITGVGG